MVEKPESGLGGRMYVYLLTDPRTETPFYVGQARCIITRLGQHLAANPHKNTKMAVVLDDLKRIHMIPKISVLEVTNKDQINKKEAEYIKHYYELYPNLCNLTSLPKKMTIKTPYTKPVRRNLKPTWEALIGDDDLFND